MMLIAIDPQVEVTLRQVVAETLGVDVTEINDASSSQTISSWNSYNHLTVITTVEEVFGILFSMEEMTEVADFGQLKQIVALHLAEKPTLD